MTYGEARRNIWLYRIIGFLIVTTVGTTFLVAILSSTYAALDPDAVFSGGLHRFVMNGIATVYQHTTFLEPLWTYAPVLNVRQPFTAENAVFLVFWFGMWIGWAVFRIGNELAADVREAKREIRNSQIRASMSPQQKQGTAKIMVTVEIPPPSFWDAFLDSFLWPLLVTVIGAALVYLFGLS